MYQHTQSGMAIRWAMLAGVALTLGLAFLLPSAGNARPAQGIALFIAALLLAVMVVFGSLTISVADRHLSWSFGPGAFRKTVPLADIVEATPVRTTFIEGWGIHFTRRGWLYNVSGSEAVWIRLASGKQFVLGTDEPAELVAAIQAARSTRRA